jgi:outer membrane protein OmpA-like peptidoglycan-associated protein
MPIKQFLSALAIAGLLAGCSSDINTLRTTPGTGSPFTKALTDEYRRLSIAEAGFRDADPEIAAYAQAHLDCLSPVVSDTHTYILYFNFDKSELSSEGGLVIDQVIADARKFPKAGAWPTIAVTGHTDLAGAANYNFKLSLRRADAIRAALIKAGIPAANISTAGRGEGEPALPTADGVAEAKNRRVVVIMQ